MKLEIANLEKTYENKEVLKNIDFTFESGKIYGLLGRNGAGKTTFFNSLNEDIEIDNGKFYLIEDNKKHKLLPKDIGYVTATPTVPEFLTGKEFLQFFIDINQNNIKNIKDIDYYFNLLKIDKHDQDLLMKEYSHGMKNKMQILINIIANPKVILLDEPLTSLDIVVQEDMKNLLKSLRKDHIIILSTHILELATDLCDEIVILTNKKLELVEKNSLNRTSYKEKIINELKEETNV